jgi:TonB family protein
VEQEAERKDNAEPGDDFATDGVAPQRLPDSSRLLWLGALLAAIVHAAPFITFGDPAPLGEGVLTEAIAVELVDRKVLEGKDQTPPAAPSAAAPPPQAPQSAPPGPKQKAQPAVPPSPPPMPPTPRDRQADEPAAAPPAPALPAFKGDGDAARPEKRRDKDRETAKDEKRQAQPPKDAQAQPKQPPQPQRPPPRQAVPERAPPTHQPAKAAPPRAPSAPAQAKSGEVTQFAKDVVAALAKAKPESRGIKGSVTVTVVVAFEGGVRLAKVTGSSGREDLDALALEAAKQAKLPAPPPDVSTDDLFYDVEYKFE